MLTFSIRNFSSTASREKIEKLLTVVSQQVGAKIGGIDLNVQIDFRDVPSIGEYMSAAAFGSIVSTFNNKTQVFLPWTINSLSQKKDLTANDQADGGVMFSSRALSDLTTWDGLSFSGNSQGEMLLSAFSHELLHIIGFADHTSTSESSFGNNIKIENGKAFFVGTTTVELMGKPIQMESVEDLSHIYRYTSPYQYDLMNPTFIAGANISDLDLAMLKDSGLPIAKTLVSPDGHTFIPGTGLQNITGTAQTDKVVFDGSHSDFRASRIGDHVVVTENLVPANMAVMKSIEYLHFDDMNVDLTVQQIASNFDPAKLKSLTELYIAYFDRLPDGPGMAYWITQMKQGKSIADISESFLNAAYASPQLTGYSPDFSNSEFVKLIYNNVLDRHGATEPSADEIGYWVSTLVAGTTTRPQLISNMLTSAHSFKGDSNFGWVADLLDNKVTVGIAYSVSQGIFFDSPELTYNKSKGINDLITPNDISKALLAFDFPVTDFHLEDHYYLPTVLPIGLVGQEILPL